jgi:hypothetical protein
MKGPLILTVIVLAVTTAGADQAVFFMTPTNATGAMFQPDANAAPLHIGATTMRYQQVIAASEFFGVIPEGGTITYIEFRTDERFGTGFLTTFPSLQFDLSTTLRGPDQLSSLFANNVGSDNVTVQAGALTLFAGPGADRTGFFVQTPFFYNPNAGNLLLDIRNFGGGNSTLFDAVGRFQDPVSRVYAFGVERAVAEHLDTLGLVVGFAAIPIPEPDSVVLLLVIAPTLWFFARAGRIRPAPGQGKVCDG